MNYAVIDIGSNTIRLSVYKAEGESFILLFSDKANAGLAGYIKKKIMTKEGIDRACIALEKFKKLLSQFTVESVSVIATAALRNVDNSKEAVKEISDRTGYSVELISGHEEALLGYYGVLSEQRINEGYIIDIGGGSAEITYITKGMPSTAVSLPVGSLNLYSKFGKGFLPNEKEFRKMSEFVSDTLKNYCIDDYPKLQTAVCVGGTARAALRLINSYFELDENNRDFSDKHVSKMLDILSSDRSVGRPLVLRCCPDRVHTITPGMIILKKIIKKLEIKEIKTSNYGVREGYLCKYLLKNI